MKKLTFWQLAASHTIGIPIIQRDYAQGRKDRRVDSVRDKFLQALHGAITGTKPLLLDFVYGEEEKTLFTPFDGQQRLTTLFLLHWYAASRERMLSGGVGECLRKFQYEVREGARLFGQELVKQPQSQDHPVFLPFDATNPDALSSFIMDQSWFRPNWVYDPTVMGMLTMLDAIHDRFHDVPDLWLRLTREDNPPVAFFFEQLVNLGSSAEDIFIKMNARGKQLTDFEHFKAQFIEYLEETITPDEVAKIADQLDTEWMDLFWASFARDTDLVDKAQRADACFHQYFGYLSDILLGLPFAPENDKERIPETGNLIDRLRSALSPKREQLCSEGNLRFLITSLEKLYAKFSDPGKANGIADFFNGYFLAAPTYPLPVPGKISLFTQDKDMNLFALCCEGRPGHASRFMLLACLLVMTTDLDVKLAARRLRILRNILAHSSREFTDDYYASQLRGVYTLMTKGRIDGASRFNTRQLEEEKAKEELRNSFSDDVALQESLNYLEDHPLLRGRLAVFSKKDHAGEGFVFERETVLKGKHFFALAFGETPVPYDTMVRGLLSQDDYALRDGARLYLGSEGAVGRHEIFATPDMRSFLGLRNAMQSLVEKTATADDSKALADAIAMVADAWAKECQKNKKMNWRYYFVQYPEMRPDLHETTGYYHWGYDNPKSFEQFHLSKMTRRANSPYWNPFLWAAFVAAGFNDDDSKAKVRWQDNQGSIEHPILFPRGLGLWMNEFAWWLGREEWDKEFTDKQEVTVHELHEQFEEILDEDGWVCVPGKDSAEEIDYAAPEWKDYREYDTVDRIQLILPVMKALAAIK